VSVSVIPVGGEGKGEDKEDVEGELADMVGYVSISPTRYVFCFCFCLDRCLHWVRGCQPGNFVCRVCLLVMQSRGQSTPI
jgi:hypothetical protein